MHNELQYLLDLKTKEDKAYDLLTSDNFYKFVFSFTPEKIEALKPKIEKVASNNKCAKYFRDFWKKHEKIQFYKNNVSNCEYRFLNVPKMPDDFLIPNGFDIDLNLGIVKTGVDAPDIKICAQPIIVTERYEDVNNGTVKVKLNFIDYLKTKELVVDLETISIPLKIQSIIKYGLMISPRYTSDLIEFLQEFQNINRLKLIPKKSTSKLGWFDNSFLPLTESDILFTSTNADENKKFEALHRPSGTLDDWVSYTKPLRKNIVNRLHLAASFSGPLISKLNTKSFIFYIWGGTGVGKTVSQEIAASVWGHPKDYITNLNSTTNSMYNTASFHNHLTCFFNELQSLSDRTAKSIDNMIMNLSEGEDKGRLDKNAESRERKKWATCFSMNGEEPIIKNNAGGGTANRVIEIECIDSLIPKGKGNEIVTFYDKNYGTAGREFIKNLHNFDIKQMFFEKIELLQSHDEITEKQIMSMAVLLVADDIATKIIFKDDIYLTVDDVAPFLKTKTEALTYKRAYDHLISWISQNASKIIPEFPRGNERLTSFDVWGEQIDGGDTIYIDSSLAKAELLKAGFDFRSVAKEWQRLNLIEMAKNGKNNLKYEHKKNITGVYSRYFKLINVNQSEILVDLSQNFGEKLEIL